MIVLIPQHNVFVTLQMKATEQYFPEVMFTVLYKVILAVENLDKILKSD